MLIITEAMTAYRQEKQIPFIHMTSLKVFKMISSIIKQLISQQRQKRGTELGYSHVSMHTHKAVIN